MKAQGPKQKQHVSGHQVPRNALVVRVKLLNQETAVGSVENRQRKQNELAVTEITTKHLAAFTLRLVN